MPNISSIPLRSYQALAPYQHVIDNMPINDLADRLYIVNAVTDQNASELNAGRGTATSLSDRLNQALNASGTIKSIAVDSSMHKIASHIDGDGYVRMLLTERNKISTISPNANSLGLKFNTVSTLATFDSGYVHFKPSSTIVWRYESGYVYADDNFPSSVRHTHYYDLVPVSSNIVTPDYINYKTTSLVTQYKENTLRVYLNGIRLSKSTETYIPIHDGTEYVPTPYSYTEGAVSSGIVDGTFALSAAIDADIVITIDFDVVY